MAGSLKFFESAKKGAIVGGTAKKVRPLLRGASKFLTKKRSKNKPANTDVKSMKGR